MFVWAVFCKVVADQLEKITGVVALPSPFTPEDREFLRVCQIREY